MTVKIEKRDGRIVDFSKERIYFAINRAAEEVNNKINDPSKLIGQKEVEDLTEKTVASLVTEVKAESMLSVEQIQDAVVAVLKANNKELFKAYKTYRDKRTVRRQNKSDLFKIIREIGAADLKNSNLLRDNGNVNGATVASSYAKAGGECWKFFNLSNNISPEYTKAHMEGDIHIHDLDYEALTMNCLFIPLAKLLKRGFDTGNGWIRAPKYIQSAAALCSIIIQTNQNQMFGGQGYAHIDDDLAPFVNASFQTCMKRQFRAMYMYNPAMRDYLGQYDLRYSKEELDEIREFEDENFVDNIQCGNKPLPFFDMNDSPLTYKFDDGREVDPLISREALIAVNREVYQAMEAMIHNLNSLFSRSGNQLPFSSINYGCNTTKCGRMVIRNILKAVWKGLGDGSTAIFPIGIFKMMAGISSDDPNDPNFDLWKLACKVVAKRFYPNFVGVDAPYNLQYVKWDRKTIPLKEGDEFKIVASDMYVSAEVAKQMRHVEKKVDGEWWYVDKINNDTVDLKKLRPETVIATMGCRTRVISNVNGSEQTDGRGNLWFTTMNLPAMAIRASKTENPEESFWKELDFRLDQCAGLMMERYNLIAKRRYENFPFLMGQGLYLTSDDKEHKPTDTIEHVLKQGSNSIGYIGIYETCRVLGKGEYGTDKSAFDFGLRIVKRIREYCDQKQKETHLNWSCFATPAENVCGRFAEIDLKRFGSIERVTDKGYYTNSHMLPFNLKTTLYNKIKHEAPFHALANAGHIFYHKIDGDPSTNLPAVEKAISAMYHANMGYFTITMEQDHCFKCGYTGVIKDCCPKCGQKDDGYAILRIARITGYLVGRPKQSMKLSWGNGKLAEYKDRLVGNNV